MGFLTNKAKQKARKELNKAHHRFLDHVEETFFTDPPKAVKCAGCGKWITGFYIETSSGLSYHPKCNPPE